MADRIRAETESPLNRVTVVHIISGDLWAGPENQLVTLLGELRHDERFAVRVIALNSGILVERLRSLAVPVTVVEERSRSFLSLVRGVAVQLAEGGATIVHSHRYKENVLAALVAKRAGVTKLVQTVHGVTEVLSGLRAIKAQAYLTLNRIATRHSFQRVIAVSDEIRAMVQRELGPRPQVVTIRNAVALETLRPLASSVELRRQLGVAESELVVGMIGRLVRVKGVDLMLEALLRIRDAAPNVRLVLAGDGPERRALESRSRALGIGDSVSFLGNREDIPDLLQSFDLFVISSLHEGIPTVLLEALAMERAVVATAVGGIPEVVRDAEHAMLVPPSDADALAQACLRLLESPSRRTELGRAGRARVEAEFSATVLSRRVGELYAELLAESSQNH